MEDLEKLNRNLSIYSDLIDKTNRFINNLDKFGGTYFIRDLKGSFPTFSSFPDDGVVDIDTLKSLKKKLEDKRNKIDSEIMRIKVQSIKSKRDETPLQVSSVDTVSGVKKSVVSNTNQVSRKSEVKYLPEEVLDLRNIKYCDEIQKYLSSLGADINKYKKVIIEPADDAESIDFCGLDVDFYCKYSDLDSETFRYFFNVGRLDILSSNFEQLNLYDCGIKDLNVPQSVKYLILCEISDIKKLELSPYLEELELYGFSLEDLKIPQSVKRLCLHDVSYIENLELSFGLEELKLYRCNLEDLKIPQSVKSLCLDCLSYIENLELLSNLEQLELYRCSLEDFKIPQSVKSLCLDDVSDIENLELPSNLENLEVKCCSVKSLEIPQSVKSLRLDDVSDIENLKLPLNLESLRVDWCSVKGLKIPQSVKSLRLHDVSDIEKLKLSFNLEELCVDKCNIKGLRIPSNLKKIIFSYVNDLDLRMLELIPLNVEIEYRGYDDNITRHLEDRKKRIRPNNSMVSQPELVSLSQIDDSELAENIEKKKKSKSFIVKLFQGITRNQEKNKK